MEQIIRIGIDTSKRVFQLHGVNAVEEPVLRKKLRRKEVEGLFEKLSPTVVADRSVRGLAPLGASPAVVRARSEADPSAICQTVRQARQERCGRCRSAVRGDEPTDDALRTGQDSRQPGGIDASRPARQLIRNRTQLANAIRGYAAEYGLIAAKGMCKIEPLLERIAADKMLPDLARSLFALHAKEYAQMQTHLKDVDAKLMAWHRAEACSQRLAQIHGVGPIGASLLVMKTPAPETFRSARHFAAWLGLTPKDHSTAGRSGSV